jgi:small subunit ribosomal protein S16
MAVHIRLSRVGAKKAPQYRVVVADQRSPRGGRFIEKIGTYDPSGEASALVVNRERLDYWRGCGAQPSHTLERLLKAVPVAATAETVGSSIPSPKGRAAQKSS